MEILNLIANIMIFLGSTLFTIGVFGRYSKKMDDLLFLERFFVKAGLSGTAAGALYNLLTMTVPPPSEIFMNLGVGILFCWAAWFHWKYFVLPKSKKD